MQEEFIKIIAKAEFRLDVGVEGKANKSIVATAKTLDTERMNMRRKLFEAQDAIDAERDKLIKNAEKSLQKPVKSKIIFAIDWRIAQIFIKITLYYKNLIKTRFEKHIH